MLASLLRHLRCFVLLLFPAAVATLTLTRWNHRKWQRHRSGIDAGVEPKLNFKGYLVGNGVTDEQIDGNALIPFVHGMGLISDDLYEMKINPSIIARMGIHLWVSMILQHILFYLFFLLFLNTFQWKS